jgi:hypothetical protein
MTDGREKPERLELAMHRSSLRRYLLMGALLRRLRFLFYP